MVVREVVVGGGDGIWREEITNFLTSEYSGDHNGTWNKLKCNYERLGETKAHVKSSY